MKKIKNFRILVIFCAFIMSLSIQALGPGDLNFDGAIEVLIGAGVGAGAAAVLGAQKGAMFGKLYAKSLGALAAPTGAVLGGVAAIVPGAIVGGIGLSIMMGIARDIRKKITNARKKLQELFMSSRTLPGESSKPDHK